MKNEVPYSEEVNFPAINTDNLHLIENVYSSLSLTLWINVIVNEEVTTKAKLVNHTENRKKKGQRGSVTPQMSISSAVLEIHFRQPQICSNGSSAAVTTPVWYKIQTR